MRKVNWINERDHGADARTLQVSPVHHRHVRQVFWRQAGIANQGNDNHNWIGCGLKQIDRTKKLDFAKPSSPVHMEETRHTPFPPSTRAKWFSLSSPFWTALPFGALSFDAREIG